ALGAFTALLERDELAPERRAAALNWRGYLYKNLHRLDEALADFSSAIELQPEDDEFLVDRGRLLLLLMRHGEALADLDRAVAANPDDPKHLLIRSMAL